MTIDFPVFSAPGFSDNLVAPVIILPFHPGFPAADTGINCDAGIINVQFPDCSVITGRQLPLTPAGYNGPAVPPAAAVAFQSDDGTA